MKPATGNNSLRSANKVSIQLALDGHSFSVRGLDAEFAGSEPVKVEVLSDRTMLVPKELFDAAQAEALLAANGMPLLAGECTVCSDPHAEIVAIMAVGCETRQQVADRLGARVQFTTPLLRMPASNQPAIWLHRADHLLYIKVYDGTLRLAEVIPAPTDADILYFMEQLSTLYAPEKFELHLDDDNPRSLSKLLGKRFKQTICE